MDQSKYQKLITDLKDIKERLNWLEKDHLQIKKDLEKLKPNTCLLYTSDAADE